MKLISMTDFVLQQDKTLQTFSDTHDQYCKIIEYANFLKQPLTLGMFIPCDDNGNVLNEPEPEYSSYNPYEDAEPSYNIVECENYKQAILKVIFNGIEVRKQSTYSIVSNKDGDVWITWNKSKNIESLIPYNLDLAISF